MSKVLSEQCATCIFRPGNLMKLRAGRVRAMVAACIEADTHIPCHETMDYDDSDEEGYAVGVSADAPVCRGFYDRYPGVGQLLRISERLGLLEFVEIRGGGRSRRPPRPRSTSGARRPSGPGQ